MLGHDATERLQRPMAMVSQVREIFTRLLRTPAPSPERIAGAVTRVFWRKEAGRIYKWHKATGTFPPHHSRPDTNWISVQQLKR